MRGKTKLSTILSLVLVLALSLLAFGPVALAEETTTTVTDPTEETTPTVQPVDPPTLGALVEEPQFTPQASSWDPATGTLVIEDHTADNIEQELADFEAETPFDRDDVRVFFVIGGEISLTDWTYLFDFDGDAPAFRSLLTLDISDTATTELTAGYDNPLPYNTVETVLLPDTLTRIGHSAFDSGFENLTTIIGGENVTSIGVYAFYGAESLPEVDFPLLEEVEEFAFHNCNSITSMYFPRLARVYSGAFEECLGLRIFAVGNMPAFFNDDEPLTGPLSSSRGGMGVLAGTDTFENVPDESVMFYTGGNTQEAVDAGWPGAFVKYIPAAAYSTTVGSVFALPFVAQGETLPEGLTFAWDHNGTLVPGVIGGAFPLSLAALSDSGSYVTTAQYEGANVTFPASTLAVTSGGGGTTPQPTSPGAATGDVSVALAGLALLVASTSALTFLRRKEQ